LHLVSGENTLTSSPTKHMTSYPMLIGVICCCVFFCFFFIITALWCRFYLFFSDFGFVHWHRYITLLLSINLRPSWAESHGSLIFKTEMLWFLPHRSDQTQVNTQLSCSIVMHFRGNATISMIDSHFYYINISPLKTFTYFSTNEIIFLQ
jgi:hypothetical protein